MTNDKLKIFSFTAISSVWHQDDEEMAVISIYFLQMGTNTRSIMNAILRTN